ncbi:chorismate-binding protein [Intrasporangium calvum]|uniref:Chorismate binding protein n=1 Tax=Intrasporangium calvum (strain ATCC 23552 / DSM 43043 / JCM 3097 / NBRC 12989 / NCIMB 10167 / NRRL B-3866 / 7 KIP) TaxID=710696 RepID=E6SBB9_INTC7|nr:anthranilate synthase component I family protein [Intrasporangium calvum]ADU48407.1 Chorismate binding protein [Intrasporangium calvum DSM 43043]
MDHARFRDRQAREVIDVRRGGDALEAISGAGFWAVVATFEGAVTAIRFGDVRRGDPTGPARRAVGWAPLDRRWHSSLSSAAYVAGVEEVRRRIADGTVYQVNLCRVLSHRLAVDADLDGLDQLLRQGNPAPHAARIRCVAAGVDVVSASPELFLARRAGRLVTRPIKGTAPTAEQMLPKDHAENVMIVDLMRNDLSGVCEPGTVSVDELCALEPHPGLVHLVSTVSGRLRVGVTWPDIFGAAYPPGSVSGAPKSSALRAIADLEAAPRGPYCGAVGWVDADAGEAELAVGIRTFWAERDEGGTRWLRFGTGAGITWHSDPAGEWAETELKAARLVGLAAGTVAP